MDPYFPGLLLKKKRIENNWSQEGLCKGICAVSYLSKIEQGKASASDEILRLLFARLNIVWHDKEEALYAGKLADDLYDAVFAMDEKKIAAGMEAFHAHSGLCQNGPYMLDFLLLEQYIENLSHEELVLFSSLFDNRQMCLWLLWKEEYERTLPLYPCAYTYARAGIQEYVSGSYAQAIEHLQYGFNLAAADCLVYVMLNCRLFMGNCYSNLSNFDQMLQHYTAARRLADALSEEAVIHDIEYNIASTAIQLGRYKEGYDYFKSLQSPSAMSLHKLAVCCEALGRPEEALNALEQAKTASSEVPDHAFAMEMCALVEYRLTHPDYLHQKEYGDRLLACFARMKQELPAGYAAFHLPWLEEWYTANRQYRQAYELLKNFP